MMALKEKILEYAFGVKAVGKTVAIAGVGVVNGKEYPMIEYDGVGSAFVIKDGLAIQKKFGLNQFALFQTKNGFHVRFYFDNQLNHEQVKEIIAFSKTNKEYASIASRLVCVNRNTGKHRGLDVAFLGLYGDFHDKGDHQVLVGKSLLRLHTALTKYKIKKEFL